MAIQDDLVLLLEGILLTYDTALSVNELRASLENRYSKSEIVQALATLQEHWNTRALELKQVADGLWRFQSREQVADILRKLHPEQPPKYSRAVMETLAVIAYRQPVTRGDIEKIRGVGLNPNAIRLLMEREWIEVIGRRETPGHPELFGTTEQFLLDLGLNSLADLPTIFNEQPEPETEPVIPLYEGHQQPQEQVAPLLAAIDAEHTRLENLAQNLSSAETSYERENDEEPAQAAGQNAG